MRRVLANKGKIMTKDNAQKKAIRSRMQQTGEPYSVARRRLEETAVEIWELGEDGGRWFIQGTTDITLAKRVVHEWIDETLAVSEYPEKSSPQLERDKKELAEYHAYVEEQETVFLSGEDWFWRPVSKAHPDDEAYIEQVSRTPERHTGQKLHKGVLIYGSW
jgi:hypothetical protein